MKESPLGHVIPGLFFFALGLWHLFNNIKLFCLHPKTFNSSLWFPIFKLRHLELYLIMLFAPASIYMELFTGSREDPRFDSDGTIPSNHLRNFEHSSISLSFLVYAILALLLDQAGSRAPASQGLTNLAAAAAFTQQLILFHFHSTDHMGIQGRYHFFFQFIVLVSILTTLMGISLPKSFFVSFLRSASIAFQGLWLIVMGFMLYTPSLIPKGCFIHDEGTHRVVRCSTEEALHRANSLVNIEFCWLFVIITIFIVILYLILHCIYGENIEYSRLTTKDQTEQDDEEQQHIKSAVH